MRRFCCSPCPDLEFTRRSPFRLKAPALISEGAGWAFGPSEVERGVELIAAPHSSVAVRNEQRRDQARTHGHRGVNGGDPRQRGAGRLRRERPLRPRARRYRPHDGRPMQAGRSTSAINMGALSKAAEFEREFILLVHRSFASSAPRRHTSLPKSKSLGMDKQGPSRPQLSPSPAVV